MSKEIYSDKDVFTHNIPYKITFEGKQDRVEVSIRSLDELMYIQLNFEQIKELTDKLLAYLESQKSCKHKNITFSDDEETHTCVDCGKQFSLVSKD
jgi:hypothetical protein